MTVPVTVPTGDDPLEAALAYAALGWRTLPITPGAKRPALPAWTEAATTDPEVIRAWWTGLYRGHGVGIAPHRLPDGRWMVVLDVDGASHDVDGQATLDRLLAEHGPLPATVEAATGGGGRHLFLAAPDPIPNRRIGDGLETRGVGGQVLVAPSGHPSGASYRWVEGHDPWSLPIADMPGWLFDRMTDRPRTPVSSSSPPQAGDRPGDRWAAVTSWDELLGADGWTRVTDGPGGEQRWVRPGKHPRDGVSATVGYGGWDRLKVFTTNAAPLEADATYSKLGYLAATRFGGDHGAASRWLASQGWGGGADLSWIAGLPGRVDDDGAGDDGGGEERERSSWWPIDLSGIDDTPVLPLWLSRHGGGAVVYPGRNHWFQGEPESLKTWLALIVLAEVLEAGRTVLVVDFEDGPHGFRSRLRALGVDPDHQGLRYVHPTEPLADRHGTPTPGALDLVEVLADLEPAVAIVDGVTVAMELEGLDPLANADVATWLRRLPRRITATGAACICIDHVTKSKEGRGRWAIGAQHKLAAVDGAALVVEVVKPLARAETDPVEALARVKVVKDRPGAVRALCRPGSDVVGDLEMTAWPDGGVTGRLVRPASGGSDRARDLIVRQLTAYPGSTKSQLRALWNSEVVDQTLLEMVEEGCVRVEKKGQSHCHWLVEDMP